MKVLVLKNISIEGAGNIAEHLTGAGHAVRVAEPEEIAGIGNADDSGALVVMGGPQAVYEHERHVWMAAEMRIIDRFINKDRPVLGVCLGAQLMAHVLGARVYKGTAGQEIGWMDIKITEAGMKDSAFSELSADGSRDITVLQWHGDTFDIPSGATRLAGSAAYENQAFKYGSSAYALQFHVEATPEMIGRWFAESDDVENIIKQTGRQCPGLSKRAGRFYGRLFGNS